jgi:hypothetical protein
VLENRAAIYAIRQKRLAIQERQRQDENELLRFNK